MSDRGSDEGVANKRPIAVFDGHNDVLLRLWRKGGDPVAAFFADDRSQPSEGHLDYPRALKGGFCGGFFAIFVPPPPKQETARAPLRADSLDFSDLNDANSLPVDYARRVAMGQAATLVTMSRQSKGRLKVAKSKSDLHEPGKNGSLTAIMHMEGAEAIGEDLFELELFFEAGLRSLGPVWSRPNIFGFGVPMNYPSSPDIGPGLTQAGRKLVRRCNELGVMIDLSHLNEKGFWDVAKISDAPLVATHSNVHQICESSRNLTDEQLKAIKETGGVVGLNFATGFLRGDGRNIKDTPIDWPIKHLSYLVEKLGEEGVAIGSDFDGAVMPAVIGDVAGLPVLVDAMERAGFGDELIRNITKDNWISLLKRTWRN